MSCILSQVMHSITGVRIACLHTRLQGPVERAAGHRQPCLPVAPELTQLTSLQMKNSQVGESTGAGRELCCR
jgi:hypothetical protein